MSMLVINLALFLFSLFVLVKSADYAVNFSSKLARVFHVSEFVLSFFLIAVISCLPEATVAIVSATEGASEFGLGTLFGSNVADLSLVFGTVALASKNGVRVKSEILKNDLIYLVLFLIPLLLGFDSHFSREEGFVLVLSGMLFFANLSRQSKMFKKKFDSTHNHQWPKNLALLVASMIILIASAYYTVEYGIRFANDVQIPSFIVALTIVSVGTCMPELIFSMKAVKTHHDEMALGDILGTVIIDATIGIGLVAIINPFYFNPLIIYTTGFTMFLAAVFAIMFIKSENILTKKEGIYLLLFYIASIILEFIVNKVF